MSKRIAVSCSTSEQRREETECTAGETGRSCCCQTDNTTTQERTAAGKEEEEEEACQSVRLSSEMVAGRVLLQIVRLQSKAPIASQSATQSVCLVCVCVSSCSLFSSMSSTLSLPPLNVSVCTHTHNFSLFLLFLHTLPPGEASKLLFCNNNTII